VILDIEIELKRPIEPLFKSIHNSDGVSNSMEQSPSSASKIPCLLWNSEVHYHVYKSLLIVMGYKGELSEAG
jgi:hypothetical protein